MSRSYQYTERMNGEVVDLTLPATLEQAKELYQEVSLLAETDPLRYKAAVRMWSAADLYFLGLLCSWWQRRDAWTGRLEVDCDFQFNYSRWVQFESDDCLDYTARAHGKSTWRHTRMFQEIFRDPETTIGIFSFDLQKGARKHLVRWKTEAENNAVLRSAWDEVLYWSPKEEGAYWSVESGCTVKRRGSHIVPTVSAYTFMHGLPTGARFTFLYPDDVETEETTEAEEQRVKVKARFRSALNLAGRSARKWIPFTFHHPAGLGATLIKEGWKSHCLPAEDVTQPAPDIAELYDRCGGIRPDTGATIPLGVRDVKLAGAPVYLHALECAIKRFEETNEVYEMQSMGNPLSGQTLRFRREWVAPELRIKGDLYDFARGKIGYILSDPSRGLRDPSVGLVLAADSNQTLTIVDGFRKKVSPAEWAHEMYMKTVNWSNVMQIRQIRVEIYGQATWDEVLRGYFREHHYAGPPIYGVGTYKDISLRVWTRLEPLFRQGRLRLPDRLLVTDETGRLYDLIAYFLDFEYDLFPLPSTDDVLAALALLGEPADKVPEIEYPESREMWDTGDDEPMPAPGLMPGIDEDGWLWQ